MVLDVLAWVFRQESQEPGHHVGNSKVKIGEDEIARYLGKDNLGASREVPEKWPDIEPTKISWNLDTMWGPQDS